MARRQRRTIQALPCARLWAVAALESILWFFGGRQGYLSQVTFVMFRSTGLRTYPSLKPSRYSVLTDQSGRTNAQGHKSRSTRRKSSPEYSRRENRAITRCNYTYTAVIQGSPRWLRPIHDLTQEQTLVFPVDRESSAGQGILVARYTCDISTSSGIWGGRTVVDWTRALLLSAL